METEKLFEYEKIGRGLIKIEKELSASNEKKRASKLDAMWKNAIDENKRRNYEADELMNSFEKTEAAVFAVESKIKEISETYKSAADMNEIEYYEKKLAALSDELQRAERELSRIASSIESLVANDDKKIKEAAQVKANFAAAMKAYQELKNKLAAEGSPINAQMKALEKDIPENIIAIYKRCKSSGKLPAFVKYDNDGSCLCGINLPNDVKSRLKNNGDMAECPTCGRLIIKCD